MKFSNLYKSLLAFFAIFISLQTSAQVTDMRININSGVTYTRIRSVSLKIDASGAVQMMLANDSSFRSATWQKYTPITPQWFLTEGEGEKKVFVKFKDAKGKDSKAVEDKIVLDKTPPLNSSILIDVPEGIVKNPLKTIKLKLKADEATFMMLSNQKDFVNMRWESYKTEVEWLLDATADGTKDGLKQVFVKFRDKGSNISEVSFDVIMVDTQVPVDEQITTTLVKKFTIVPDIMLNLFVRGGTEMMLSEKPDFAAANWQPYETSLKWKFTTQGKIKLYAKFRDEANNESGVSSTEVVFDNIPPTDCTLIIDEGAEINSHIDRVAKLKIFARDAQQMIIANSLDFFGATWIPYSETMSWKLAAGRDGNRSVYIRFKDAYGNETLVYGAKIMYEKK